MFEFSDLKSPKEFGHIVGMTDRAMARLGIWCCEQAAAGLLGSEDAINVLMDFNRARKKASGDPRVQINPHKVQVSKLARIIMVGETFGDTGVKMLETFSGLHMKKFIEMKYGEGIIYNGEYNGMVEVAREAMRRGKVLSRNDIIELVTVETAE